MALAYTWPADSGCAWAGCGQAVELEVLVAVAGEASRRAVRVGGYCVGHAVIMGIEAQARHGGQLWYALPAYGYAVAALL